MKTAAIIAAGGIGKRMDADRPKQYLELLGKPIICHTLDRFREVKDIWKVVIVVPPDFLEKFEQEILKPYLYPSGWQVVAGGEKRQHSVRNGLHFVPEDYDVVLVHDACRPFVKKEVIEKAIALAFEEGAAIAAVPIRDTVKKVGSDAVIHETVERQHLWRAQTPQVFRLGLLREAMDAANRDDFTGTDDAQLVERLGSKVMIVESDERNIKITTPGDLIIAEAIAKTF